MKQRTRRENVQGRAIMTHCQFIDHRLVFMLCFINVVCSCSFGVTGRIFVLQWREFLAVRSKRCWV